MSSPLWLDYRRAPPGRQRPGWMLLATAVAILLMLLTRHAAVTTDLDALQAELARIDAARLPEMAAVGTETGAAPLPAIGWEKLFAALEFAGDASVTLLSMQPEAGAVRLGGEAENHAAAVDYAGRLNAAGAFASVSLTQTEVLREHPQRPVRFALLAQWPGPGAGAGGVGNVPGTRGERGSP